MSQIKNKQKTVKTAATPTKKRKIKNQELN